MAHPVKCAVCAQTFDRDKFPYVQVSINRYAHATCRPDILSIIDPTDEVVCKFCKQKFRKSENPDFITLTKKQFAHKACAEQAKANMTDEQKLDAYICELFNMDYVYPMIRKQIKQYISEYHFTYSGILNTLKYAKNNKHLTFGEGKGIGIVPYIYHEARQYYYEIWRANHQEENEYIFLQEEQEVRISPQKRRGMMYAPFFSFLDEEVKENAK